MPPLLLVSFLLHAYVGWRVLPALADWPALLAAFALLLASSLVLIPSGLRARRPVPGRLGAALTWSGLVLLGALSSLAVLTVLRDAALLLAWAAAAIGVPGIDVAALAHWSAVAVPLAGGLATLVGFANARRTAAVVDVALPVEGLPAALDGFTIVQISDLHVGPTIRRGYVESIVRRIDALDADLVAITGDLVDGPVATLAPHVAPLAGLRSRHGTFFVTGNHDYYSGAHGWIRELRRLGMRVLINEHAVIGQGGASLVLAGVTDWGAHHFDPSHRSDPLAAIEGAPPQAALRVLLAHQPRSAPAAARAGFDLQLSGHTHGGQFLPWPLFVRLQQPFTAGLHRLGRLRIYVSRGTGYWGPPKRFGAPSEITRLRLVAAAAAPR